MTIAAGGSARLSYAGNGVTTAFTTPQFLANADIVATLVTDATGVETPQVLTTNYTLAGAGAASGTLTMLVAPPTGTTLVIYTDPAVSQDVDLVNGDTLDVDVEIEAPLDKLTLLQIRTRDLANRALRLPEGDTGFVAADLKLPAKVTRASNYLAFDVDGKPIATAGTVNATPISAFMATVVDDSDAGSALTTLGFSTFVKSLISAATAAAWRALTGSINSADNVAFTGANTHAGTEDFNSSTRINADLKLTGDISPAQITADQNDYNPTGLSSVVVLRLNSDAQRIITGLAGGADGRILTLFNIGSFVIGLKHENAGSSAANRFNLDAKATGADALYLLPNSSVTVMYDATSSRWRPTNVISGLGVGQTWQNVTGSRTLGVTYTNDTGRPIAIGVTSNFASSTNQQDAFAMYVGTLAAPGTANLKIARSQVNVNGGDSLWVGGIVPPGYAYQVADEGATHPGVAVWAELR